MTIRTANFLKAIVEKNSFFNFSFLLLTFLGCPISGFAQYEWLNSARVFLIDAYQPPFAPKLEFDAEKLARTMVEMHVNVVRMSTMGKYATVQGTRFPVHPDQGERDLLAEMIAACKPRGIKVIPYISTGHKLAWSTVTEKYPDYAQRTKPGGGPQRDHMYVGEDMGTVCWNTSYREAYLDYVTHVVKDYDISGIYFDTWRPFYFWQGKQVCYCGGCVSGFRKATGLDLPYHEKEADYTEDELKTIDKYHAWYKEELIAIMNKVREIVKANKDIPLIYNINNPDKILHEDPRVIAAMDAFLYERGESILERAEGVSLVKTLGMQVMPYIGGYDNWPRIANNQFDIEQQIYTTMMFGGIPIISQPYPYVNEKTNRKFVADPFTLMNSNEKLLAGLKNEPYVAVVYSSFNPEGHAKENWWWKADARLATLGAFAACLYNHIQVTSTLSSLLDNRKQLSQYKVVYLADNVFLSDNQIRNLKQFVSNGGGLIVSYSTSLYDKDGKRNSSFALADLLKLQSIDVPEELNSYQAMIGGPNDLYLSSTNNRTLHPKWNHRLVPLWFYEPVKVENGGEVLMNIVTGDGDRAVLPGVILSHYGKGKVIYSATSMESLFQSNGNPVLKELISDLISIVSPSSPTYTIKAPSTLIANMVDSGNQYLLHLTNWTGNKFEKTQVMEDYIAPVENVQIDLNFPPGKVASVKTLNGSPFTLREKSKSVEVVLPKVGIYEGVLFSLK
jgi:putative glycosyl hydrolase-like family 6 (GHL6) protein/glycosyl hydrolase family 42 (putative beta-galactosidase)